MSKVGYFGIKGSYSYSAAHEYFGDEVEYVATKKFAEVFNLVKTAQVDYGVIPIENSLAGSVYENYDLLKNQNLKIVGEHYLKIDHCLLGLKSQGVSESEQLKKITKVYAHPQALAQCAKLFEKYSWLEKESYGDNASAAEYVSQRGNVNLAAIASEEAAKIYNLDVILRKIADNDFNITRFFVLSNNEVVIEDANKCSIVFTLPHTPGSLYGALRIFQDSGVNLTKIESRPLKGTTFEYSFYADFVFDPGLKEQLELLIDKVQKNVDSLTVLGVYRSEV